MLLSHWCRTLPPRYYAPLGSSMAGGVAGNGVGGNGVGGNGVGGNGVRAGPPLNATASLHRSFSGGPSQR